MQAALLKLSNMLTTLGAQSISCTRKHKIEKQQKKWERRLSAELTHDILGRNFSFIKDRDNLLHFIDSAILKQNQASAMTN